MGSVLKAVLAALVVTTCAHWCGAPWAFCGVQQGWGLPAKRVAQRTALRGVSTFGAEVVKPQTTLQWLQGVSAVVPDQFSFTGFEDIQPRLGVVSSRTVLEALDSGLWPDLDDLVQQAVKSEQCAVDWDVEEESQSCFEEALFTLMGRRVLEQLPFHARVSTEIPLSSLSTAAAAVGSGKRIAEMYRDLGIATDRFLLRLPASYEGLRAAEALEAVGLRVHLTHVYSLEQAALASEAGVFAAQVYIGRTDRAGGDGAALAQAVHRLFRSRDGEEQTALIVASLGTEDQITQVSGAEYLLVPPKLLEQLRQETLPLSGAVLSQEDDVQAPQVAFRSFLASKGEFDDTLPPVARKLLEAGLSKYEQEQLSLDRVIEAAQQYM